MDLSKYCIPVFRICRGIKFIKMFPSFLPTEGVSCTSWRQAYTLTCVLAPERPVQPCWPMAQQLAGPGGCGVVVFFLVFFFLWKWGEDGRNMLNPILKTLRQHFGCVYCEGEQSPVLLKAARPDLTLRAAFPGLLRALNVGVLAGFVFFTVALLITKTLFSSDSGPKVVLAVI